MPTSPSWPPWKENRRVALAAAAIAAVLGAGALLARGGESGGGRAELARLALIGAWFAALMWALRRPPRARAARQDGVPVLRASAPRRLALPLLLVPLAGLVVYRTALEGGNAAAMTVLGVVVFAVLAWLATRADRRFALLPDGVELRVRRGRALLRWDAIREVRVEVYRRHAGLVLLGDAGQPSLGVSVWLDGVPELARALLERVPARAVSPESRARLEALAVA